MSTESDAQKEDDGGGHGENGDSNTWWYLVCLEMKKWVHVSTNTGHVVFLWLISTILAYIM